MAEWKPDLPHRPEIGKIDFTLLTIGLDQHDALLQSAAASLHIQGRAALGAATMPHPAC